MTWRKFSGEVIQTPILEEVEAAIERETNLGNKLKVCIGTDSQVKGAVTDFATVIVFIREAAGAFMFIHQERTSQKMSIKERMLCEVQKSIDIAYKLCDLLDLYDVGWKYMPTLIPTLCLKAMQALHEAMGYILSMGFVFKAKPEAFASSCCANKMVQ
jgi:predicted RNase H-related nuclease YkuK (DUF458 family)